MTYEFENYARGYGISPMVINRYGKAVNSYINPLVIEERRLNVASMDIFSRLLMDRVIFIGVPINDDVANIIQAQLLFLASNDPKADISMYINTPAFSNGQDMNNLDYPCLSIYLRTVSGDASPIEHTK